MAHTWRAPRPVESLVCSSHGAFYVVAIGDATVLIVGGAWGRG